MTVLAPTRNLDNIVEDLPARGHGSINTDSDVTQNQRTVQNAQRPQLAEEPRPRTSSTLIGLLTISALLLPITIVPFFLVRRRLLRMEMTLDKISQTYENAIRLEVQRLRSAQEAQQILLQNLDKRLFVLSTESKSVHKELVKEQMGIVRRLEENEWVLWSIIHIPRLIMSRLIFTFYFSRNDTPARDSGKAPKIGRICTHLLMKTRPKFKQ